MNVATDVTKLCDGWWARVADAERDGQQRYNEEFLRLLGWMEDRPVPEKALALPKIATTRLLGSGEVSIACHFVMPGVLEPPSVVLNRGLDFGEVTRVLTNATRSSKVQYAFITDLQRFYLYDAEGDELLSYADCAEAFETDLRPYLEKAAVERGALEEVRRQPRSSAARQLRRWAERWTATIQEEGELDGATAGIAIDRLMVARYLDEHDVLHRPGWGYHKRFSDLRDTAFRSTGDAGKALVTFSQSLWDDWKIELFRPAPELDDVLRNDVMTRQFLKEFALLSRSKFCVGTILESFNYGDAAERARVRMVAENDSERAGYLAKQQMANIDQAQVMVDLREDGYRAIFHWFDKLADCYKRLGAEFDAVSGESRGSGTASDLFEWPEQRTACPEAVGDTISHLLSRGLVVYYGDEKQYRTARMLLYLHVIGWCEREQLRLTKFPPVEAALHERPAIMEHERPTFRRDGDTAQHHSWRVI